jgi:hypothetical protein
MIVFGNKTALDQFKSGKLRFTGSTSAIALKSGVAQAFKFEPEGWQVIIHPQGGLMAEISVGGQSFSFMPK